MLFCTVMKYRLTILYIFFFIVVSASAIEHTYAPHSILREGHWVKIQVSETGVHQITYEELLDAGLQPDQVRIYGYGGAMLTQAFNVRKIDDLPAVPFWMEKGADGIFGKGDYILFYAQANISWSYNGVRFIHTRNPYSDYGYYFLTDNVGEQRLLNQVAASIDAEEATDVTTFANYMLHEKDLINLLDVSKGCDGGGREFYGETFQSTTGVKSFSFPANHIDVTQPMRCVVDVASYSTDITYWNVQQGSEQYTINMQSIPVSDYYTMATVSSINKDMYPASSKDPTLFIQYNASLSSARGYLNYIEITPMCSLQLESNQLAFRSAINYNESKPIRYILHNVTAHTQIWNVTQLDSIYRMPISLLDNTLSVVASNIEDIQQLIAVNVNQKEGWLSPKWIGEVSNQDLHSLSDIDLVIISPSAFIDEAKLLAKAHEEKDQMTVAVVTDEQIYNEFSSGNPDATAYRWIMKMLYDRGINGKHKPGHLLLFGDGTFDNRQLLISPITGKSTGGEAWLLTYQTKNSVKETDAFAMDDYFAFMENNEGESDVYGTMEFGVGRLPINSKEEAQQMVTKITNYLNNANYGKWKNQILFIADDGDNGLHTQTAEAGAETELIRLADLEIKPCK